jgi:hypothetical protein
MQISLLSLTALLCASIETSAFAPPSGISTPVALEQDGRTTSPLFMGRAAAVRAATKSKTDMKKAKTNALYGKRIIMAVKAGGSASTDSNRALAEVVKQAKANNVPVDVSAEKSYWYSQFRSIDWKDSSDFSCGTSWLPRIPRGCCEG